MRDDGLSITAARLIDALEKLPRDTLIFVFDQQIGERFEIDPMHLIDFWDEENGHADINLLAVTEEISNPKPFDPMKGGKDAI